MLTSPPIRRLESFYNQLMGVEYFVGGALVALAGIHDTGKKAKTKQKRAGAP